METDGQTLEYWENYEQEYPDLVRIILTGYTEVEASVSGWAAGSAAEEAPQPVARAASTSSGARVL